MPTMTVVEEFLSLTSHDISTALSAQDRSVEILAEVTALESLAEKVDGIVHNQDSMAKDLAVLKAAMLDLAASKMPAAAADYGPPEQQFLFPSVQQQLQEPEAGSSPSWTVVGQGVPYRPSTTNPLILALCAACSGHSSDLSGEGKKIIDFFGGKPNPIFHIFWMGGLEM